jgi:PAS domain S-box-containing protein
MTDEDLSGRSLGRYHLLRRLGEGTTSVVYLARPSEQNEQDVALKVLAPALVARPGFRQRFERDVGRVVAVSHPSVLPVYEYGIAMGHTFVATEVAPGGSLRERILQGPMRPDEVLTIMSPIADALHSVHRAGIVHSDLKPSNVLFDAGASAVVSDFGMARTHLGFAIGTPGYMAPEQAAGDEVDARADVYACGAVIFEMLTGTPLWPQAPVPEMLMATVTGDVPSLRDRRPDLPAEVEAVLSRALSRDRESRQDSTIELLWELSRFLDPAPGPVLAAAPKPEQVEISPDAFKGTFRPVETAAAGPDEQAEFERAHEQLMRIFETALSAAIAVDGSSFVTGWNATAEATFGWTRDEIIGRSLSSTLIPPQYREAHERGFKRFLETGEGPVLGTVIEITAMNRDGREFPIELSITPAARSGDRALFVGFARDITEHRRSEQLKAAREGVGEALGQPREVAIPAVLEAIGSNLGWPVGVFWEVDGGVLRSRHTWKAEAMECPELEQVVAACELGRDAGLAGRVWTSGDGVWAEDLLHEADMRVALPALRAGLRSAAGVPILRSGEVCGVLEFYGRETQPPDEDLLNRLFDLGRKVGARLREPEDAAPDEGPSEAPVEHG